MRTSLLSQKSPTCEASLPWSIQGVFKHGKLPSVFFSSTAGKSPRKSAMIFPAKNTFFLIVFPCLSHILWLSFPSRVGTSHRCLSWGFCIFLQESAATKHITVVCSVLEIYNEKVKAGGGWWRLAEFGPLLGASFGAPRHQLPGYHSYFYPSSSKRYPPSQQDIVPIDSDYRSLL